MTGYERRRIFEARFPLEQRFGDIADLPDNGHDETKQQQLAGAEAPTLPVQDELPECECRNDAPERPAHGTGACFSRREHWGESRTAQRGSHNHGSRVGDPGDDKREQREEDVGNGADGGRTAVPDRDQEGEHAGGVAPAEDGDRHARERPAGRPAPCHGDHEGGHQPKGTEVKNGSLRPVGEQGNRRGREPAGALQRLDSLAAAEVVDLARAQHSQHRQRRRQRPASHPDDRDDQRNGDR